jgi:biotin transporter BioY
VNAALATGLYPFIVKDFIKVSIASGVLPAVWKFMAPPKAL